MSKRSDHPTGDEETAKQQDHPELKHPSTKRAKQIDGPANPYDELVNAVEDEQAEATSVRGVAHWFRSKDLRAQDNIALRRASQLAQENGVPLLAFYLYCAPEFEWHGTGVARADFIVRALAGLQAELKDRFHIPLVFLDAPERKDKVPAVRDFLREHGVSHLFANYEYEVDELRRDRELLRQVGSSEEGGGRGVRISLHHDQTVVEPGSMVTGSSGKPMRVFTPFHKEWLAVVADDPALIDTVGDPEANDKAAAEKKFGKLFDGKVPEVPKSLRFPSDKERDHIRKLWPAGHDAGMKRLDDFLRKKVAKYAATRSNPAKDSTSRLSAYFAAGMVSVREALSAARELLADGTSDFSSSGPGGDGLAGWVREICFRELYRQSMVGIPHNSMNLPQNLKFEFVNWEEDEEGWRRWCDGTTGVPFVDAGMRQLAAEAYMHNRLRMNVSSYLTLNLLIDYRRGERYFAQHLVDWDLCNNTQGWEPSYTVFNPTSQAERNDPDGEYIRRWVPELKDVEGKAVFAPYERLSEAEFKKLNYPKPYVDWKETKQRAMERFKNDMAGVEP